VPLPSLCKLGLFIFIWLSCESLRASCDEHLLALFSRNPHGGTTGSTNDLGHATQEDILRFERAVPGRFGGHLRIYRHIHKAWMSRKTSARFDPLGDPRWFWDVVGLEGAALLGMYRDEDLISFPDPVELLGRLAWISAELEQRGAGPLHFGFYLQLSHKLDPYIEGLRNRAQLPLAQLDAASVDNHYLHDLIFHLSTIFLPEMMKGRLAERLRYFEDFLQYARQARNPQNEAEEVAVSTFVKAMKLKVVELLDYSSAWLTYDALDNNAFFRRAPSDHQGQRSAFHLLAGSQAWTNEIRGFARSQSDKARWVGILGGFDHVHQRDYTLEHLLPLSPEAMEELCTAFALKRKAFMDLGLELKVPPVPLRPPSLGWGARLRSFLRRPLLSE
jgi:hypothetical protein